MNTEDQGRLLDRIARGLCAYGVCGMGGIYPRRMTWIVNLRGRMRAVTLDVRVCEPHNT